MSDPPDNIDHVELFRELKQLDADPDSASDPRKCEIIHHLAEVKYYEAKPYFIAGLKRPDPEYRFSIVTALAWMWRDNTRETRDRLLRLAKMDPSSKVRERALFGLARMKVKATLPLLKGIVLDDSALALRRALAYSLILEMLGYPMHQVLEQAKQFDASTVDQELLSEIPQDADSPE